MNSGMYGAVLTMPDLRGDTFEDQHRVRFVLRTELQTSSVDNEKRGKGRGGRTGQGGSIHWQSLDTLYFFTRSCFLIAFLFFFWETASNGSCWVGIERHAYANHSGSLGLPHIFFYLLYLLQVISQA